MTKNTRIILLEDVKNLGVAGDIVSTSEGYIPVLDLTKIMPPFGIKLDRGTVQKLALVVRDDTTGVDGFDCIAYGFERFK